ncbi:hypothetical protein DFA_07232 [Cavenderia fasciculata]|uniref:Uncharacterized protein n=1 Tax=Cavenderia fasciculata TaxID=261658 RepID=F4PVU9_CACFS|nr:uncharacterized protein DFA_07232 [Cavenderia fasciculata]EGG20113.1 hypothetical protein DFA_07232 [Cavenderia fasciculata]|eukprot:XP_004367096.1 hypothetical protein DFA_07232 [Cavenderia fasciculata]
MNCTDTFFKVFRNVFLVREVFSRVRSDYVVVLGASVPSSVGSDKFVRTRRYQELVKTDKLGWTIENKHYVLLLDILKRHGQDINVEKLLPETSKITAPLVMAYVLEHFQQAFIDYFTIQNSFVSPSQSLVSSSPVSPSFDKMSTYLYQIVRYGNINTWKMVIDAMNRLIIAPYVGQQSYLKRGFDYITGKSTSSSSILSILARQDPSTSSSYSPYDYLKESILYNKRELVEHIVESVGAKELANCLQPPSSFFTIMPKSIRSRQPINQDFIDPDIIVYLYNVLSAHLVNPLLNIVLYPTLAYYLSNNVDIINQHNQTNTTYNSQSQTDSYSYITNLNTYLKSALETIKHKYQNNINSSSSSNYIKSVYKCCKDLISKDETVYHINLDTIHNTINSIFDSNDSSTFQMLLWICELAFQIDTNILKLYNHQQYLSCHFILLFKNQKERVGYLLSRIGFNYLCQYGRLEQIQIAFELIQKMVKFDTEKQENRISLLSGHLDVIKYLVDNNNNNNNNRHVLLVDFASQNRGIDQPRSLRRWDIVEYLIINARHITISHMPEYVLHDALLEGRFELADILTKRNPNLGQSLTNLKRVNSIQMIDYYPSRVRGLLPTLLPNDDIKNVELVRCILDRYDASPLLESDQIIPEEILVTAIDSQCISVIEYLYTRFTQLAPTRENNLESFVVPLDDSILNYRFAFIGQFFESILNIPFQLDRLYPLGPYASIEWINTIIYSPNKVCSNNTQLDFDLFAQQAITSNLDHKLEFIEYFKSFTPTPNGIVKKKKIETIIYLYIISLLYVSCCRPSSQQLFTMYIFT